MSIIKYGSKQQFHNSFVPKRIGMILLEADLVSPGQIEVALYDKVHSSHLRLGEILALRGWIQPETADFFAQDWQNLIRQKSRQPLGWYLQQAALLNEKEINTILEEQKYTGIRFGSSAVVRGMLKSTTLDFFLMHLFPQEFQASSFQYTHSLVKNKPKDLETFWGSDKNSNDIVLPVENSNPDDCEIKWIG